MPPLTSLVEGRLFGRRHGEGPPRVLALHGWGRTSADFDRVLAGLDGIAVDLPGFGASPAPAEVVGAAGYAEAISELAGIFPEPPVVVGHSFGGRVAVAMVAGGLLQARHLVLAGVPLLRLSAPPPPTVGYRLLRLANRLGVVSDERMEARRRRSGSSDYRAATGVMRGILVRAVNETYEAELGALGVPVRLVWGEEDREVPVAVAEAATRRIGPGSARLDLLPGIGHQVPLQAPDALRRHIEEALT